MYSSKILRGVHPKKGVHTFSHNSHINNVFTGALAYTDDVTIICPSLRGLNKMLEMCNEYAAARL